MIEEVDVAGSGAAEAVEMKSREKNKVLINLMMKTSGSAGYRLPRVIQSRKFLAMKTVFAQEPSDFSQSGCETVDLQWGGPQERGRGCHLTLVE